MWSWLFLALFLLLPAGLPKAQESRNLQISQLSEKRVALVIGNDAYRNVVPLKNAVADARAMAKEFRALGFEVIEKTNIDQRGMKAALRDFVSGIANGGIGAFFYAGHGVQEGGNNYLLPVDIGALTDTAALPDEAVELNGDVMARIGQVGAKFSLLVIDACRDNPFPRKAGRSIGSTRGLGAAASAPEGMVVVYSAGVGQQALDRLGPNDRNPNGLFTREFVREIRTPGLEVAEVVRNVRRRVKDQAASVKHEQTPAIYIQADRFYLKPGEGEQVAQLSGAGIRARTPAQIEDELWDAIKDSEVVAVFEKYLAEYPSGRYATLAQVRLIELKKKPEVAAPSPTAPSPAPLNAPTLSVFKDCEECPEMVVIPAGSFEMRSKSEDSDEKPIHSVRITRAFALGRAEVTRGQFAAFVSASGYTPGDGCFVQNSGKWEKDDNRNWRNPGYKQTDSHPVACISWDDASAYVNWLARKTGKSYRFPSEAEWEYACRAGGNHSHCGSDNADSVAWYGANSGGKTHTVAEKQPNAWGLYDMSGNVWEWVKDCWDKNYQGAPSDGSAWASGDCRVRVHRGGSWNLDWQNTRATSRSWSSKDSRINGHGFRPAMTLP